MKRELPSECGGCGLEEGWLLHHVCVRNTYRRLCTSCVLKLHSGSFCPICFEVYEEAKLPENRVMCLRCPSVTHPNCVSKEAVSSFVCPPCSNPSFTFFDSSRVNGDKIRSIDEKMSKVLASASQIAYISMSKAARGVKMEADRKVKEASLKRKEAKEALGRIVSLVAEKKGNGTMIVGKAPLPIMSVEQRKIAKGNNALSAAVVAQQRLETKSSVEAVIKSAGRVAVPSNNFVAKLERQQFQNPSTIEKSKNSGYSPQLQNNVLSLEKEKNSKGSMVSGMVRQLPLPNQDSLVKNSNEGARLGTSNKTS